jgi:carbon monoxide dehydrogenase subunit G
MHFEGEFSISGTPDAVMRRFTDIERMARCMPGAVIEGRADDGGYLGAMVVAFGPKKINFRGRVTHEFDTAAHTGTLTGRGAADMRAARIGVKISYALRADPDAAAATSVVKLVSDADLTGVLADFARTGGIPVANALMAGFAKRMTEEFADETPAAAAAATAPTTVADVVPLAAHGLLWDIVKAKLLPLARWLGLAARPPKVATED